MNARTNYMHVHRMRYLRRTISWKKIFVDKCCGQICSPAVNVEPSGRFLVNDENIIQFITAIFFFFFFFLSEKTIFKRGIRKLSHVP